MVAPCHASGVMKYKQFVRPNPNMSIDLYSYQLHRAPRAMNIFFTAGARLASRPIGCRGRNRNRSLQRHRRLCRERSGPLLGRRGPLGQRSSLLWSRKGRFPKHGLGTNDRSYFTPTSGNGTILSVVSAWCRVARIH